MTDSKNPETKKWRHAGSSETGGSSKLEASAAENETAKKYVHLMRLDHVTRIFDSYFTTSMKFYTIHTHHTTVFNIIN